MITLPENREQALALYFTCKEWSVAPHVYVLPPEIPRQDKLDIDFVINNIGKAYEAEEQERLEKENN